MIKLEAIGHLGKDATVNDVNGKKVINFSICHTEKYKQADGSMATKSTWVECAKWGDSAAVAPYLLKGGLVYVQGTPEVRTFPKNDGTTGASLVLRVTDLQLLGGTKQESNGSQQAQPATSTAAVTKEQKAANAASSQRPAIEINDDLPF